ncbi:MAG: hypothetical protein H0X67_03575 [Acidobacteria bacterium]|nr:hypothetical protein [Acidobacteriota bacterium]
MADIQVRSDDVDIEQIMSQIRARIREKRGVDYSEEEIRELARVKLEKFLDPGGVRSDLLAQFRRTKAAMPAPPNFAFEDSTLFESHRGFIRFMRKLFNPILKLFFNPNPLIQALHIQSELNTRNAQREELDSLHYELIHNLVIETTRLGIEVKNLKMRLESMSSRLDFDERRARALEGVVQYRPGAVAPLQPAPRGEDAAADADQAERRRRRRRRGRRRPEPREGATEGSRQQVHGEAGASGGAGSHGEHHTDAGDGARRDAPRETASNAGNAAPAPDVNSRGRVGEDDQS